MTGAPPEFSIVEALEPAWYFGQRRFFDRGGHVPNARMWSRLDLHTADGRFKPPAEIRRMAAQLGLKESTPVLTYCGGGVAATLPWFALHVLLGWPEVRVYIGSQREWLRDERVLPMWTWAEPGLLRQAEWLVSWNDDLLRMTGSAQLGVLDVRPAAEHALGHVPHAFNLPPERWEALRRDPAALRATLAASGLDPRHEIVLVGRGGLDPAAALAWETLESLGHRRVSLLLESTDEWALRGHPLTKPPSPGTATPPRRPQPGWTTLTPAPQPARAATGDSPRQTLRVDSSLAAATTADTITLPWTEFVNADRSLKPPHQIHERLVKAGLSRWAHIEVKADDPAEAAAALFVLRLVGWPSVEVAQ
jgi:3-mercaptopyruvate sulfurtransferase SseA